MEIIITMLVANEERQAKYKQIIEQILLEQLDRPIFYVYQNTVDLYQALVEERIKTDIILLQASNSNIELMNKIRQLDRNFILIYSANTIDYIFPSLTSMPMAYVIANQKGHMTLVDALLQAGKFINQTRRDFVFETKSKVLKYNAYEIEYFESQCRYVHIVKTNGSIETINFKLDNLENEYNLMNFVRCHQSYYINMNHIIEIDKTNKRIILQSGVTIPSSKKHFTNFLTAYLKYQGGK